jgi:tRNA-dihydrouridine synthase
MDSDAMTQSDNEHQANPGRKRLAVAPMMEWTDRHCRSFHRQLSKRAVLYTEMVTTGALLHGDVPRHLDYSSEQHPVVLQLGGSEPADLAKAAALAAQWGYDEIDLNCGCPSERVQRGAFGACLMAEPQLVADCVRAMRAACALPISVKHRLGLDHMDASRHQTDYQFVLDFMLAVADAGAHQVTIHARNAVLKLASDEPEAPADPFPPSFILIVPLFHVTGCVPVMLSCFMAGLKLVIMYKWDAGKALPIIAEENITNFVGVPTQSWDLVNHPDFDKYDTSSLRAVGLASDVITATSLTVSCIFAGVNAFMTSIPLASDSTKSVL